MDFQSIDQTVPREEDLTVATYPTLSVTRQQIVTLSRVLEQIPESFITGEGLNSNQSLGLTVVDENMPSTMITTSSQEDTDSHLLPGLRLVTSNRPMQRTGREGDQSTHLLWACSKSIRYCNFLPLDLWIPTNPRISGGAESVRWSSH